jgi:hypothetical protein
MDMEDTGRESEKCGGYRKGEVRDGGCRRKRSRVGNNCTSRGRGSGEYIRIQLEGEG